MITNHNIHTYLEHQSSFTYLTLSVCEVQGLGDLIYVIFMVGVFWTRSF